MRTYKAAVILVLFQLCLVFAASPPNSLSLTNPNLTSVSNWTLPQPLKYVHPIGTSTLGTDAISSSVLPPDPYLYRVPQSSQSITFSRYSRTLRREDVQACLLEAALEVIKEINRDDGPVDRNEVQTSSGHALLILHPDPRLTWRMWGTTIVGINNFLTIFEFVDCDFEIDIIGYSSTFGTGLLVYH